MSDRRRALLPLLLVAGGVFLAGALGSMVKGAALIAVGLAVGLLTKTWRPRRIPWDWPLGILALLGGLSLIVTALPDITWPKVAGFWSGLVLAYFLACWADETKKVAFLAWGMVLAGLASAGLAPVVVQWSQNKQVWLPSAIYGHFHLLITNSIHPNTMASLMVLLAPLPLTWAWQRFRRRAWGTMILLGGIWVLMMLILLLTQSRGGIIAGVLGILASVWLVGERKAAVVLVVLLLVAGVGLGGYVVHHQTLVPQFAERSLDPSTMAFRLHVWRVALWMITDFPFTGVGMGLFNEVGPVLYPFSETQNPGTHNLYLGVAVDLGLLGLIAFLSLLITLARMAGELRLGKVRDALSEQQALAAGMFAGLIGLLAHGLFDNTIWNTRASFLLWLVIGGFTAAFLLEQAEAQDEPPAA